MELNNLIRTTLSNYFDFLKIPSISIEKKGIEDSINWLHQQFTLLGANQVNVLDDFGSSPVIVAKFDGNSDTTLLIYNHYDVQPIGNLDLWHTDPFHPTLKDEKLVCQGASDCKGEIISRMMVIDYFKHNGGLPCNIIFFIEGEEEIGSPNLKKYVEKYKHELSADVCLWECGWKNEKEQIEISCGVKGILSFDLEATTANRPIHSAYAGIVPNPSWQLIQCLSSFKNSNNEILIDGFYDYIAPVTHSLHNAIQHLEFDSEAFKLQNGLIVDLVTSDFQSTLVNSPTLNISMLQAGDDSSSNSIPSHAIAKIDCRFVPNQTGEKLIQLIQQHLIDNQFDSIHITNITHEPAFRTDVSNKYVTQLVECAKNVCGKKNYQLVPNLAGGGPMSLFGQTLNIPTVAIGCSYSGSNVHSANENIRLQDLYQIVHCLKDWMETLNYIMEEIYHV